MTQGRFRRSFVGSVWMDERGQRARSALVGTGAVLFSLSLAAACSSSDPAPAGTPVPDGGATDAPAAQLTPFEVWVMDEDMGDITKLGGPIADATIAWDPPGGGERVEVKSGADGHATLQGDFTKGGGAVTVFAEGRVVVSSLDASPENTKKLPPNPSGKPPDNLVISLIRTGASSDALGVLLTGTITNRKESGTIVRLDASGSRWPRFEAPNAGYRMRVPKEKPYFLIGIEAKNVVSDPATIENTLLRAFRIDRPAHAGDAVLDIDLATTTPVTTKTVKARIEMPGGAGGPFGNTGRCLIFAESLGSGLLGAPIIKSVRNADGGSCDGEIAALQTDFGTEVMMSQGALVSPDNAVSIRLEPGIIQDGFVFKDFLDPPAVTIDKQLLTDPLAIEGIPDAAEVVRVDISAGGLIAWVVFQQAPSVAAKKAVNIPKPPTGMKVPASFEGRILFLGAPTADTRLYTKLAVSRPLTLTKP